MVEVGMAEPKDVEMEYQKEKMQAELKERTGKRVRQPVKPQFPYVRKESKIQPNDKCPCGSNKKYKNCCG